MASRRARTRCTSRPAISGTEGFCDSPTTRKVSTGALNGDGVYVSVRYQYRVELSEPWRTKSGVWYFPTEGEPKLAFTAAENELIYRLVRVTASSIYMVLWGGESGTGPRRLVRYDRDATSTTEIRALSLNHKLVGTLSLPSLGFIADDRSVCGLDRDESAAYRLFCYAKQGTELEFDITIPPVAQDAAESMNLEYPLAINNEFVFFSFPLGKENGWTIQMSAVRRRTGCAAY